MERHRLSKKSSTLTYRHYLLHFKWPLLGFLFVLGFLMFSPITLTSLFRLYFAHEQHTMLIDKNVIYPVDIFGNQHVNRSISSYFSKKDQLKIVNDKYAGIKKQKIVLPLIEHPTSSDSYLILGSTKVFGQPKFCSHTNEQIFGHTCPYTNCKYTCDQTREADAQILLMHKRDLNFTKLAAMKRNADQIWLLWHDEPNENTPEINMIKFNWTITYRTSAEASIGAYGLTSAKQNPWSIEQFNAWIDEQFDKRHDQAVWFVSNCRSKKRLQKFSSLRKHYPIVAFGKCIAPNDSFSLNAHVLPNLKCTRQSSCEKDYLSTSKFYLAFESQSCTDYITEKFWRTLAVGAIPIVSGPKREDYQRIVPPHSFIHVNDYRSDSELAQALHSIANDKYLFGKYHYWRRFYDVYYEGKDLEPYRFCELCYRLNTNRHRIWYENINDWFLDQC